MSSASGSSAHHGLPVADSDVTLPYESSASGAPPRRRGTSRVKPGTSNRSKSAPRVSVGRKTKASSVGKEAPSALSLPGRSPGGKDKDVLRLQSTVRQMDEAWQTLNVRAAQEMSEQQWRIESARHELEQARLDNAGIAASARSAVGQVRAEAAEGMRNMETEVSRKFTLSEEEISRRHSNELQRVEADHQRRLREAVHEMEREKEQLKQSAEQTHASVMHASSAAQVSSTRVLQEQVRTAEVALAERERVTEAERARERQEWHRNAEVALMERERLTEAERTRERQEWHREKMRHNEEMALLQQQLIQMKSMMESMQLQMVAAAPPPPPPPPASSGTMGTHVQPQRGVSLESLSTGPPPGFALPAHHDYRPGRGGHPGGDGGDGGMPSGIMEIGDESSQESTDPDSSGDGGHGGRGRRRVGGKREAVSISLNPLPTGAAGFRRWRTDALRDIAGAAEKPRKAFRWLAKVTSGTVTDGQLNRPGANFESLDGKMLTALGKVVTAHPFLQRKLHSYYESQSELTSGRVTLRRIIEHYGMDADMNGVYSVSDFMQCSLMGQTEDALERFCEMWIWIETGLVEPVAENIRESLLWTQLKGSALMQAEINRYRLAARGHPDHSYGFLLGALQRHVQLYRQEKNREDFLKGLQNAAGGQQKALIGSWH
eukprot:1179298-Amphidinium_carterae.1